MTERCLPDLPSCAALPLPSLSAQAQRADIADVGLTRIGSHTANTVFVAVDKQPLSGRACELANCIVVRTRWQTKVLVLAAKLASKRLSSVWLNVDCVAAVNGTPLCMPTNVVFE